MKVRGRPGCSGGQASDVAVPGCPAVAVDSALPGVAGHKGAKVPGSDPPPLKSCLGCRRSTHSVQFNNKKMTTHIPREWFKAEGEGCAYRSKVYIVCDGYSRPTHQSYSGSRAPIPDPGWKRWESILPFASVMARTRAIDLAEGLSLIHI